MRQRHRTPRASLVCLALALFVLLSIGSISPAPPGSSSGQGRVAPSYVPGELLIKFKEDASPAEHANARAQVHAQRLGQFRSGAERWKLNGGETTDSAIAHLRNNPHVRYVEPNYRVGINLVPNDPRYPELYGMNNHGQTGGTPGADIRAESAWSVTTGSRSVVVAVIDTGVDMSHPDLQANIWTNPGETPGNGVDDDGNGFIDDVHGWDFINHDNNPIDDHGHGTHVSGTIGAVGNNGVGVVGVSWQVSIMALKFLGSDGYGSDADAIAAIDYGTAMGARIMSNSWGGGGYSQALLDAINGAGAADILFVAAAGNSSSNNDLYPAYPASFDAPNIVSVAATDANDQLAYFSNYGAITVDLGAPGVDILSTLPGNSYGLYSGTSMATPHVSGVAALIRAVAPEVNVANLKRLLLESADPIPALAGKCVTGGRLNAFRPIATPDEAPPGAINGLAAGNPEGGAVTLSWTATGDDGDVGTASSYEVRYSDSPIDDANFSSATQASGAPNPAPSGSPEQMRVTGLDFSTLYYFAVKAHDEFGNAGPLSNVASAITLGPPAVQVTPTSVSASLFTGGTATQVLTISNSGVSDLEYRVGVRRSGGGAEPAQVLPPQSAPRHPLDLPGAPPVVDSSVPPADYQPHLTGIATSPGASVLLIQDFAPWSTDANQQVLEANGIAYEMIPSSSLASKDLSLYQLVIVSSDQPTSFYLTLAGLSAKLDAYVSAGGVLEFHAAGWGWASGDASQVTLPGGMRINFYLSATNRVLDPSHPLMNGVPNPFTGSSSHAYFTAIPPGAAQIASDDSGRTNLVVYTFGSGAVIASCQTLEYGYQYIQPTGIILRNMIPYSFSRAPRWLSSSPVSGVVPPGGSSQVTLTFDAALLAGGIYTANVVVSSNDPLSSEAIIPATLTVTGAPDLTILGDEISVDSVQSYTSDNARTSHLLPVSVTPGGGGTLTVLVDGDFGDSDEIATVTVEGNVLGTVGAGGTDCSLYSRTFTLSPGLLANLVADGRVDVEVQNSPAVGSFCSTNSHSVHLQYSGPSESLDFGPLFIGQSRSITLMVKNDGTDLLVVSPIGTDSSYFSASPSDLSVQPGASALITVTFNASAVGNFTGNLSITSNDPDSPLVTIALTGQGVTPPIVGAEPSTLGSTLYTGGIENQNLRLVNTGGSPLEFHLSVVPRQAGGNTCVPTRAFVAEFNGGRLSAVDLGTGAKTTIASGLSIPFGVAMGQGGDTAYVTEHGSGEISAVDLSTGAVSTVTVGLGAPLQIALEASGTRAFVTQYYDGFLSSVDLSTGTVATIATGLRAPYGLVLDPTGSEALVTEFDTGRLARVNLATGVTTRIGPTLQGPYGVTLDRTGTIAYVTELHTHTVRAITLATGATQVVAGLSYPYGIVLDPAETTAYVTEGAGDIAAVDLATGSVRHIGSGLVDPVGIALDTGVGCQPIFVSLEPSSGSIPAMSSLDVVAHFDAHGLFGGVYLNDIQLASNDPVTPLLTVSASLTVIGSPDIDVQPESLAFPVTFTGYTSALSLKILNRGTEALHISGVRFEGEFGQTGLTLPETIPIGGSRNFTVTFSPTVPGPASGRLFIDSDDPDEAALAVPLTGSAIPPPLLGIAPSLLQSTLFNGEQEAQTLTLTNTGASDLTFSLGVDILAGEVVTVPFAGLSPDTSGVSDNQPSSAPQLPPAGLSLVRGVPGDFERLASSPVPLTSVAEDPVTMTLYAQANNGTGFYRYRATTNVWEPLASAPIPSGNNGGAALLNGKIYTVYTGNGSALGVYDIAANSWSTRTNPLGYGTGNIASDGSRYLYLVYGNQFVRFDPAAGTTANLPVPPFTFNAWGGLRFLSGKLYGHQGNGDAGFARFDVASNAWTLLPSTPGGTVLGSAIDPVGQQYIAYGSYLGTNLYRFSLSAGTWSVSTVPFFSVNDGGMGWLPGPVPGIYFTQGQDGTGFARLITGAPFLSVSPLSGTVPAGGSAEIEALFDGGNLFGGVYNARIDITSNDPAHPLTSVPAALTVIGAPNINVQPTSLTFPSTFTGYSSSFSLTVLNQGTEVLHISGVRLEGEFSQTGLTPPETIPIGGSQSVTVTFSPTVPGVATGRLYLDSDDPDTPLVTIPLTGQGVTPPVVGVEPLGLGTTLLTGGREDQNLRLVNTGGSPLEFRFSVVPRQAGGSTCVPTRALVAEYNGGRLSAIDLGTGARSTIASGFSNPFGVATQIGGRTAYVTEYGSGEISAVGLVTGAVSTVTGGLGGVLYITLEANGTRAYVTQYEGFLSSVDLSTGTVARIATGLRAPFGIALDPTGNDAIVAEFDTGNLARVNLGTGVTTRIASGLQGPIGLILDRTGTTAYVTEWYTQTLRAVTLATGASRLVATGLPRPYQIALDPAETTAYVTEDPGDIAVVDLATGSVGHVGSGLADPAGIDLDTHCQAFVSLEPSSGSVPAMSSLDVLARFDADGLFGGTYLNDIEVASNDPANPLVTVPASLTVIGVPDIDAQPASLTFPSTFTGYHSTLSLKILNTGTEALHISSVRLEGEFGQTGLTPPETIPIGGSRIITVSFSPTAPGVATGRLILDSDDSDMSSFAVPLSGSALVPPRAEISPLSVTAVLNSGDSRNEILTLLNTGGSDLSWSAEAMQASGSAVPAGPPPDLAKGEVDPRQGILGGGGPDRFGYRWKDSDAPGGPAFNWTDISATGTPLGVYGDDRTSSPIPIGFGFPFYGGTFTSVRVCTNGFLSFTSTSVSYSGQPLPSAYAPENLLAVFWSDLYVDTPQSIRYLNDGTRLIVQFTDVSFLSGAGPLTFQVILYPSGRIVYQYQRMSGYVSGPTTGIQNATRDDGLTVAFNTAYVHDNLALEFSVTPEWLSLNPTGGTVSAGGSASLGVRIDAAGLLGGEYLARIQLKSNDPANALIEVPVTLTVIGVPDIDAQPASLNFPSTFVGYQSSLSLTIFNKGTDALHISGVRLEGEFGQTGLTPPETIPIGGSRNITVTFSPTVPGTASGRLILDSDDPDEPALAVPLAGTSLLPPAAEVQPASLHSQLPQLGVETQTLTLSNSGSSDLTFTLGIGASELALPGQFERLAFSPVTLSCVVEDPYNQVLYAQAYGAPSFYRYRAASNTWEPLPYSPVSQNCNGAALLNGKIYTSYYFSGGQLGVYDIATSTWSTRTHPIGPNGGTLASDGTRYLYLVYGETFRRLDPETGATLNLPSPPIYFTEWGGLHYLSGKLYGHEGSSARFATFDIAANLWTMLPSMPMGALGGAAIDPVAGEYFASSYCGATSLSRYSIGSGDWRVLTNPFFSTCDAGMGWLPGPVPGIYIVQGYYGTGFARFITAPQFLTATPFAGTVPPGGTTEIQVQFKAGGLNPGTYSASINITTNDPAHPLLSVPATLQVYGDADHDGIVDPSDNCPAVYNPSQGNADGDQVGDACDLCTDTDADGAGNPGYPASTCQLDNCPSVANPLQENRDGDGLGDACDACPDDAGNDMDADGLCGNVDNCPGAWNAGQENADGDGLGDACDACPADPLNDADADGLCGNVDNCPGASNAGQEDADRDGPGDACDNCPAASNPAQEDFNGDGSGDACQPTLSLSSILQDGGSKLEVRAIASDPQRDPLSGHINIVPSSFVDLTLSDAFLDPNACETGFHPDGVPLESIGYSNESLGAPFLFDLDAALYCSDGAADFEMAPGPCDAPTGAFDYFIELTGLPLPLKICVRRISGPAFLTEATITSYDSHTLTLRSGEGGSLVLPFTAWPPRNLSLTPALEVGKSYRMTFTVTDGSTNPILAQGTFVYHGESVLYVNNPPTALAAAPATVECQGPSGASVLLDGSGSNDPDSTPGGHDDIIRFDWVLDAGQPSESLLGTGEVLPVVLPLGSHTIILRVTDASGESDDVTAPVSIMDTTAPVLTCSVAATLECTSPAGASATVTASASDACSSGVVITNSRNGSAGDASGVYPLGVSPVTFTATDASGNIATCATGVTVRDTVPPVLTFSTSQVQVWPANHRLVPISLAWQVTDLCTATPSAVLVSATSNELDNAPGDGDGDTTGDISGADLGTADTQVSVRAERDGAGSGRTYDLKYESADAAGNVRAGSVMVQVPHDTSPGLDPLQLRLQSGAIIGSARIFWDPVPGATGYDLIMGDLANVSRKPSLLSLGQVTVLAAGTQATDYLEAPGGPLPGAGRTWFYLMQYRQAGSAPSGYGSVFTALPREPNSCDVACP